MQIDQYLNYLEIHATNLFLENVERQYPYHNLAHTRKVVARAREISEHYSLTDAQNLILYTAAWFHDIGHLFTTIDGHEIESVIRMYDFIKGLPISSDDAKQIENCILSTRVNQKPVTFLEEILCDADLYHLGTPEFAQTDNQVKEELEMRLGITMDNWKQKSLAFLLQHEFYTSYCREQLGKGKLHNIQSLKNLLQEGK